MSQEWDWPPRRGRYYAQANFDIEIPRKPPRRDPWIVAGRISWTVAKILIAIPLTALVIAAVFFIYILLTVASQSAPLPTTTVTCAGLLGHDHFGIGIDGDDLSCTIAKSEENKVFASCGIGEYCQVVGKAVDCDENLECKKIIRVYSAKKMRILE
jgi:hypothetical protein